MPAKHQKPRVAIYARVSTLDKGQDPQNQLAVLRDYCRHRGFKVVGEFVDQASGRSENRSEYQKLLTTARRRQVDVVLRLALRPFCPLTLDAAECPRRVPGSRCRFHLSPRAGRHHHLFALRNRCVSQFGRADLPKRHPIPDISQAVPKANVECS